MNFRAYALGAFAALGLTAGAATTAQAADLEEIAAFALNICDAVNATGITISSADHCMKFSGEFTYEKHFDWFGGGSFDSDGVSELELLIEVMGDSDFGVTRGWIELAFCLDSGNCYNESAMSIVINEIGISIGNTTVLATGSGASIFDDGEDETITHLITSELSDGDSYSYLAGVYVSLTHDLGNGWSVAKAVECIDSCGQVYPSLVGVVSYDNNGIVGHLSVAFGQYNGTWMGFDVLKGGIEAELDVVTVQGAFLLTYSGYWEANASIKATLDIVELAGGFYVNSSSDWWAIFSVQFNAGDFTIAKAFGIDESGYWEFESEVSTDLSDTLSLAVNFYLDSDTDWEISKTLTWTPGGGYELETTVGLEDDGDIFADTEITLEF